MVGHMCTRVHLGGRFLAIGAGRLNVRGGAGDASAGDDDAVCGMRAQVMMPSSAATATACWTSHENCMQLQIRSCS